MYSSFTRVINPNGQKLREIEAGAEREQAEQDAIVAAGAVRLDRLVPPKAADKEVKDAVGPQYDV